MKIEKSADGSVILVTIPVSEAQYKGAAPSSTGKTLLVDTANQKFPAGGFGTLTVQVSAYLPNPAFAAVKVKAKAAA